MSAVASPLPPLPPLPPNIARLLASVERQRNYWNPQWVAANLGNDGIWQTLTAMFRRRRRAWVVALVLASPWLYRLLRERIYQSRFYRGHRARTDSFTRHLAVAEQEQMQKAAKSTFPADKVKVAVDREFLRKLRVLLAIAIPKWTSNEMWMLVLHSLFLVARTYLSVVVARLDGKIVKELIAANGTEFARGLVYWFAIAVPATYTNSMIRFLQSKLSIAFRTRITRYVHDLYLHRITYYKVLNLDSRIDGPDQLICTDIAKFCDTLSALYSNLAKPMLDIVIFNYQLTKSIGATGMVALFVNYFITARILRAVTPAFGKMAAVEAKLEGDFRGAHSRLITNAEEIAFYHGGPREMGILDKSYRTLIRHINRIYRIRISYNMFEDFVIKYSWSAVGLLVSAVPVFFPAWAGSRSRKEFEEAAIAAESASQMEVPNVTAEAAETPTSIAKSSGNRTQGFITNKRLMLSLADAGGRIMYSYKELAELAGYTARVYELISVFQDVSDGRYVRTMIGGNAEDAKSREFSLTDIRGTVVLGQNGVEMKNVPVVTPSGDCLIRDLSFEIRPGMHLLMTGPNGCGKSSVMRILSGLWPLFRGTVFRPEDKNVVFIPQRPYLSLGTLRDQVIYPHSVEDMRQAGRKDADLMKILKMVHLEYLPKREGGWEVKKEWKDVFSGGEKQRMNLARLFYHKPAFGVLDECTSAVSTDVEGLMYHRAKEMGITLLTISHRPSLFKYHTYLLRFSGEGGKWEFTQLGSKNVLMTVDAEIRQIEGQVREEDRLRARMVEINQLLGVNVHATKK